MAGILLSALAAAGDAGVQSMNQNIVQQNQLDQQTQASDLAFQKQRAILQVQQQLAIDSANEQRQAQNSRISSAQQGIVNDQIGQQYAQSDQAVAAADAGQTGSPLTPEQKAVIEQSKSADTAALLADPHTYVKAAAQTGDLPPLELAKMALDQDRANRQEAADTARFKYGIDAQERGFAHSDESQERLFKQQEKLQNDRIAAERDAASAKSSSGNAPDDITQGQKDLWLHQYIAGNGAVPRSAPAWVKNNIGTWAAEKGITPDDLSRGMAQAKFDAAGATTAGHRGGAMAGVEAAMPALVENAVGLSQKLGRGNFVPLNKLQNMADDSISDPTLAAFKVAHQALASEYQMVISRGGSNVTALKESMHVLEGARSPEAYAAAAEQVQREVDVNQRAMSHVRSNLGGPGSAPRTGTTQNTFTPSPSAAARPSLNDIFGQ